MTTTPAIRRYIFLDFETLKRVNFKKLEKVSHKIFIFVGSDIETVPFALVRDMQRIGNTVKWVEVGAATPTDLNYHICFLMGKLHEKIAADVEFAILSNDTAFDPLVNFINSTGRNCLRVRQVAAAESVAPLSNEPSKIVEKPTEPPIELRLTDEELGSRLFGERSKEANGVAATATNLTLIEETARETVRRLIRSGNRPLDVAMLRSYILLHNQELSLHGNVEKIIQRLTETKDIRIENGDVAYNF